MNSVLRGVLCLELAVTAGLRAARFLGELVDLHTELVDLVGGVAGLMGGLQVRALFVDKQSKPQEARRITAASRPVAVPAGAAGAGPTTP